MPVNNSFGGGFFYEDPSLNKASECYLKLSSNQEAFGKFWKKLNDSDIKELESIIECSQENLPIEDFAIPIKIEESV